MKKNLTHGNFEVRMTPNNYWRSETRMKRKKYQPIPKELLEKFDRLWREMSDKFPKRK